MNLPPDDLRRLARMFVAAPGATRIRGFSLGGEPRPKMRVRVNTKTGAMYVPKEERIAVKATKAALQESWIPRDDHGRLAVAAIFLRPTRHSVDLDNLVKFLLDAANGILWRDDSQIVTLTATIDYDRRTPRTSFAVASLP